MKSRLALLALTLLLLSSLAQAGHPHPEKYYQQKWCAAHHGEMEVVLQDGKRCDCVTKTHAVEFDFSAKWAESIGQSLDYARQTGRRAGVVLIGDEGNADIIRSIALKYHLPLDVWTVVP